MSPGRWLQGSSIFTGAHWFGSLSLSPVIACTSVSILTPNSHIFDSTYLILWGFFLLNCICFPTHKSLNHKVAERLGILHGIGLESCENNTHIKLIFIANVTYKKRNTHCYGNINSAQCLALVSISEKCIHSVNKKFCTRIHGIWT